MPDIYSVITTADPLTLDRLAQVIELRAADRRQAKMRKEFLNAIPFPSRTRVLEIGCGTGAVCRDLSNRPDVAEVIGLDPSAAFLQRARELAAGIGHVSFMEADGRDIPLSDASFDAVILYTTLCHIPGPEAVLREAFRLLRPRGSLAVFDGDYAATTVAAGPLDPVQSCAEAAIAALVNDPWLARRLATLARQAGLVELRTASHGYLAFEEPDYLLTLVDRGADALVASARIGMNLGNALKGEARDRVLAGTFFGHIAYFSMIGRKPA
jgi:ubiquinone/menaquinone biosynthesis C-methylase UbiE